MSQIVCRHYHRDVKSQPETEKSQNESEDCFFFLFSIDERFNTIIDLKKPARRSQTFSIFMVSNINNPFYLDLQLLLLLSIQIKFQFQDSIFLLNGVLFSMYR